MTYDRRGVEPECFSGHRQSAPPSYTGNRIEQNDPFSCRESPCGMYFPPKIEIVEDLGRIGITCCVPERSRVWTCTLYRVAGISPRRFAAVADTFEPGHPATRTRRLASPMRLRLIFLEVPHLVGALSRDGRTRECSDDDERPQGARHLDFTGLSIDMRQKHTASSITWDRSAAAVVPVQARPSPAPSPQTLSVIPASGVPDSHAPPPPIPVFNRSRNAPAL